MAKLKKPTVTLQIEVKNDDEWNEILHNEGLIVVDVYSEWSGPCAALLSTLKKIKMELGGDLLTCVLARNDEITPLKRFRGKSEPVCMFIQDGKLVNLIFGSHCPNYKKTLIAEIKRVQTNEPPDYQLSIEQRTPHEEVRFMEEETVKRMHELKRRSIKEALERTIYEEFLQHMMIELCEETALVIFPWVFEDDDGRIRDKEMCPPYLELVSQVLPNNFDIVEQSKIQLNEEMIQDMLKESDVTITDDLIDCFTDGKCVAMRLKGRLPPPSWPVPYPNVCVEQGKKCPTRAFNDVENFLEYILEDVSTSSNQDIIYQSFMDRHNLIFDYSDELEEGEDTVDCPAVWFPTNARNKVHVFKTLFAAYMDRAHPYQEPKKPMPLIAIKFDISKLSSLTDYYHQYREAIEYFGIFAFDDPRARRLASSPEDYLNKITRQTNQEIILIILRKLNDNVFLTFAGSNPIFIEENLVKVVEIIQKFFHEGFLSNSYSQDHLEEDIESYYKYEEYNDEEIFH